MDLALRVFRHNQYQELIKARDVDESDLTDLVCKCVECGNFVVWVTANSKESLKQRSAHFRHSRDVNNKLAVYCEKRVSRYSNTKIEKMQRSIDEARTRYIRKEFWKMMTNYYSEVLSLHMNDILMSLDPKFREMGEIFANSFRQEPDDYTRVISEIMDYTFRGMPIWITHPYLGESQKIMPTPGMQQYFIEQITSKLNRKLHYLICSDVLKFIKNCKAALEICIRLFMLGSFATVEVLQRGMILGLEGKDGSELLIYEKDAEGNQKVVAIDFSFWNEDKNKYIIYTYAIGHVIAWITLVPYNQNIDKFK